MRLIIVTLSLAVSSLLLNGQTRSQKTFQQKPSGHVSSGINYSPFTRNNVLKSASSHSLGVTYKPLSFPGLSGDAKPKIIRRRNSPVFIEKSVTPLKSATGTSHEERFFSFLRESEDITHITNPRESFKISGIHTDKQGITRIRAIQQYKGIDIYGSESTLHLSAQKERFTGKLFQVGPDVATTPRTDIVQSLQIVRDDLQKRTLFRELTDKEKKLLHYDSPSFSLVIIEQDENNYALAWEIAIRPNFIEEWKYFVDAREGKIIRKFNNTMSDGPMTATGYDLNNQLRTIDVYLESGTYYLYNRAEAMFNETTEEGAIITLDADNTSTSDLDYKYVTSANNSWTQKAAISAHYNATLSYEYFASKFGRNSINGLGGNILSLVNVAEDDGSSMENAFWNGQAVFYGNGGTHFKSLAGGLDAAAHELGHGVVSNTANLEYFGQSGAINESFADIFGAMVDRDDWLIGEDIVRTAYYPSGALRNMADPHNGGDNTDYYWQPAHVSEMYLGKEDNGGVHINNSIGSHAYYLFATAVGKDKAEQVFYKALTEYLTKTSQFIDFRIAVVEAAKDLYGNTSQEAAEAGEAFDAVGIQEEEAVDDTPEYEANSGQERVLIYNTDINYSPTLYTSPVSGSTYEALSTTPFYNKISVTDDGSVGVFVSDDHHIRAINIDPLNPDEEIISTQPEWDNVAISKDGSLMAAISTFGDDDSIHIFDLIGGRDTSFLLYNPTTSHTNTDAGGVLYADALEFDHTGEFLMYDAVNILSSTSEDPIYYWDIGFIKVWDHSTGSFGSGEISKLFTSLPESVSVGNPVFSKNSPNIIAFDYEYDDGTVLEYRIYASDIEKGDLVKLLDNSTWGYPSFSKNDDHIAFSTEYEVEPTVYEADIYTLSLTADKIHAADDPTLLMEYAIWPVYFATGERNLNLAPVANFTVDKKNGGAPLMVKFLDLTSNNPTSWNWTFQGGFPSSADVQYPEITYNTTGTFNVTLKATNEAGDNTISKTGYIVVSNATGTGEIENDMVLFYPNPVSNLLNIECDKDFIVRIYSLQGELIVSGKNNHQLDVTDIKPGVYLMEMETETGIIKHKLVKQ
jgi:bacillolysin